MGWNRKKGRGNKVFKKGGNLGQGVGAFRRVGAGTPLQSLHKSNFKIKLFR